MAATPLSRVRRMLGDVAAPVRFSDASITEELESHDDGPRGELEAAIELLTFAPKTERLSSIRQGSTARTFATDGLTDAGRLALLKGRLAAFDAPVGESGLVAVVEIEAPMSDAYRSPIVPGCGNPFGW